MNQVTNIGIKLQHITKRVNKLLQDKYDLHDTQPVHKFDLQNMSQMIHKQELLEAYQKSQKMSLKLKQIRTLLGFQKQSSAKKLDDKKNASQSKRQKVNLKKFVLSMRKKSQTMKNTANQGLNITKQSKSFGSQDPGLQQYTDASLKYIKSFLPHQTLIDYKNNRQRKVFSENTVKQHKKQVDSKRLQEMQFKILETLQKYDFSPQKTEKKERDVTHIDFSPIIPKWQTNALIYDRNTLVNNLLQSVKDQTINQYHTINVDSPRNTYMKQKYKNKRTSSPLEFLTATMTQSPYKTKAKQKNNKIRQQGKQMRPQTRQTIKKIVPVVLPCIPKQRQLV